MSLLESNYYDHPEGTDASGKLVALNKFAIMTGLGWSLADILMLSKPQGVLQTLGRIGYNVGPMMGMASAFTMGTYISTRMRGKDDR